MNTSPIKEVLRLLLTKHQASKKPLQKSIHGSSGNGSKHMVGATDSRCPVADNKLKFRKDNLWPCYISSCYPTSSTVVNTHGCWMVLTFWTYEEEQNKILLKVVLPQRYYLIENTLSLLRKLLHYPLHILTYFQTVHCICHQSCFLGVKAAGA
jgi:hypothetical protein